jgi:hypothetical protein
LCEVSELFTTDKLTSRGTAGAAFGFQDEGFRAFTTWNSKLSFVSA